MSTINGIQGTVHRMNTSAAQFSLEQIGDTRLFWRTLGKTSNSGMIPVFNGNVFIGYTEPACGRIDPDLGRLELTLEESMKEQEKRDLEEAQKREYQEMKAAFSLMRDYLRMPDDAYCYRLTGHKTRELAVASVFKETLKRTTKIWADYIGKYPD